MQAYLGTGCQVVVCRINVLRLQGECMEEGFEALELVGRESELAGDCLHLNAEEGKTRRRALALVLHD